MFEPDDQDSPEFLKLVSEIVSGRCLALRPTRVFLVKIDNWFDLKWLSFESKRVGQIAVWNSGDLRIPPFHPNRVMKEQHFQLNDKSDGYIREFTKPLHVFQYSEDNRRRTASGFADGTKLFVWFSGGTKRNSRGSLMVYEIGDDVHAAWFAEILGGSKWRPGRCRHTSAANLMFDAERGRRAPSSSLSRSVVPLSECSPEWREIVDAGRLAGPTKLQS